MKTLNIYNQQKMVYFREIEKLLDEQRVAMDKFNFEKLEETTKKIEELQSKIEELDDKYQLTDKDERLVDDELACLVDIARKIQQKWDENLALMFDKRELLVMAGKAIRALNNAQSGYVGYRQMSYLEKNP